MNRFRAVGAQPSMPVIAASSSRKLGGGAIKLFDTVPASGIWSPDGKALLYLDTRNGVSNVMQQSVSGGPATSVTNFTKPSLTPP